MISLTSQYAIRAVVHMAGSDRWCTVEQIAAASLAPRGYLSKVLRRLVVTRIVISQRGLNGGFRLLGDAHSLTAFDVVRAIESEGHSDSLRDVHDDDAFVDRSARSLFSYIQADVERRLRDAMICDLVPVTGRQLACHAL